MLHLKGKKGTKNVWLEWVFGNATFEGPGSEMLHLKEEALRNPNIVCGQRSESLHRLFGNTTSKGIPIAETLHSFNL